MARTARRIPFLAIATVASAAAVAGWVARRSLRAAWARFRTSSSPSIGLYDLLAGSFLRRYYGEIVDDCVATLAGAPEAGVLEIGPGPGHVAELLLAAVPDMTWTGLDIDAGMLAATRARLEDAGFADRASFVEGDVGWMPFDDASFDLVVSSLSAHHWPDPETAFGEIRRVLRPGAHALVYDIPGWWGRIETGSRGIGAADGDDVRSVRRVRGIGPVNLISRVELRRRS
jgi:SAM-dependent methyltransferase